MISLRWLVANATPKGGLVHSVLLDKPLPSNTEFEQIILGAVLLNEAPDQWLEVVDRLKCADFTSPRHRLFYTAFSDVVAAGEPLNPVTVQQRMQREGTLDQAGGVASLAGLIDGVPRLTDLSHYVRKVKGKSLLRDAIRYADWLMQESVADQMDADEVLSIAEQKLAMLRAGQVVDDIVSSEEAVKRAMDELMTRWEAPDSAPGVKTGFPDLDGKLHGLRPGRVHLLAARPGEGKTTLALNIAHRAIEHKRDGRAVVMMVSLEMLASELMIRALSTVTRIDSDRIMSGDLNESERGAVIAAGDTLKAMDVAFIEPKTDMMASSIRTRLNRLLHRYGHVDLLVVDYLQLMAPDRWTPSENDRITQISRGLKMISLNFSIPLLLLSQMNRDVEKRATNRPQLSDLRGSGSLEQDADVVTFLYNRNTEPEDEGSECVERELLIAKNRGGKTGAVPFVWFKRESRFECTARPSHPSPSYVSNGRPTKREQTKQAMDEYYEFMG